jgi:hypothetical protein
VTTIEIKIAAPELAQALNNLAAAISGGHTPDFKLGADGMIEMPAQPKGETTEPEKPKRTVKKTEATTETAKAEEPADAPSAATDEASSSTSQSEAPSDVSYPDVQARVIGLAKHSRDAATGLLGKFGVSHGKELQEEQWPAFIARADELIAGYAGA